MKQVAQVDGGERVQSLFSQTLLLEMGRGNLWSKKAPLMREGAESPGFFLHSSPQDSLREGPMPISLGLRHDQAPSPLPGACQGAHHVFPVLLWPGEWWECNERAS